MAITITDVTPAYLSCLQFNPLLNFPFSQVATSNVQEILNNETPLPSVIMNGVTMPIDEAVTYLDNLVNSLNSESNYLSIIDNFCELISTCNNYTSSDVFYWQSIANGRLHDIISDFQTFVNFDQENESFNSGIEKIIDLNEIIIDNPELPHSYNLEYNLDIALLDRMRGNYDKSIEKLESLLFSINEIESENELSNIQQWLCKIHAEKSAHEGIISFDEFMLAIQDCEMCATAKSTEIDNGSAQNTKSIIVNESASVVAFEIVPNPNQGSFKINLPTLCHNCEISIINSIGQTVKYLNPTEIGLTEVSVTGLKTGHYKVIYIVNGRIFDSQTVVVE